MRPNVTGPNVQKTGSAKGAPVMVSAEMPLTEADGLEVSDWS